MNAATETHLATTEALLEGFRVLVLCRRRIAGGVAVDVQRHPAETNWPWTVQSFTTAEQHLTYT